MRLEIPTWQRMISKRFYPWLQKYQALISYAMGLLLGLFVFQLLYDAPVFLNLSWGLDVPNDLMQHISGYFALRSAPWQIPLLYTNKLGYPEGVSVYFTDSIPLLALIFKLLSPFFSADFHYFKLWILLSFLMQPFAAVYLIRVLGFRQIHAAFFAAAFSLLVKWLIFRIGHPALCGQFVILFAFSFYVQQTRQCQSDSDRRKMALKWLGLYCISFFIHLYLFIMVMGIFVAAVLDFPLPKTNRSSLLLYKINLLLLPCLLIPILYAILIGPNNNLETPHAEGYGYFSLNITGPVYGGNLLSLPKTLGPSEGQLYEDQSYLGLGLILLALAGLFLERKNIVPLLRKSPFLIFLFIGFYLFALSTDIHLGNNRIYTYPSNLKQFILALPVSQFRASARFFWPIGYGLLFFGLFSLLKRRWALPVLACLLVVQWVDLPKPYIPRPEGYTNAYNPDIPFWDELLHGKKSLYLYPTLFCGGDAFRYNFPILMEAAKLGVTSNTAFITRYTEDCGEKRREAASDLSPHTVHVFWDATSNSFVKQALNSFPTGWCASKKQLTICIPYPTPADRASLKKINSLIFNIKSPLNFP